MKPFEYGRYVPLAWLSWIIGPNVRKFLGIRLPQDRIQLRMDVSPAGTTRWRCDPLFGTAEHLGFTLTSIRGRSATYFIIDEPA